MDATIRLAMHEDEPAIMAIDRATYCADNTPAPPAPEDHVFLDSVAPWASVLVAEIDGAVVGWIITGAETPMATGTRVHSLKGLAVHPDAQGRGVASVLIEAAIEQAQSAGATRMRSRVLATNRASIRLHHRLGFHVEGILRSEFHIAGNDVDDVLFARALGRDEAAQPPPMLDTDLIFERMRADRLDDLVDVMTSGPWEYFQRRVHTRESVLELWERGTFESEDSQTYLVEHPHAGVIGMVTINDLQDPVPLFDIRLCESARGRGWGRATLEWVTRHLIDERGFTSIEAQTRADNAPMRATLERCGYVKEAHYRSCNLHRADNTAYRILERDWRSGITTPVPWFDLWHCRTTQSRRGTIRA